MMRKTVLLSLLAALASGMASATEPRSDAPVQEDPILKTVKPKTAQPAERALPTDLPQGVDSRVQEDPLLKSATESKPSKPASAGEEKPAAMPGGGTETKASGGQAEEPVPPKAPSHEAESEKPKAEKPAKKKDSKVQEDPLLQTLEPQ